MAVSRRVQQFMQKASWIRRMFEQGAELKAKHGPENVYDFSLGNPDLEPPSAFFDTLEALVAERAPGAHRYMQNSGYPETRARIAAKVAAEHGVDPRPEGVVMSVGAAGALNVCFKALLDPGSEVICLKPYFPEYRFYVDNHGGSVVEVPTSETFDLDLDAIAAALTERTRAVIVNSPNNPTGRVYDQAQLDALGALIDERAPEATVITDEPYRKIVYDGAEQGSVLKATRRSAVATSFSKDLGLAGERIGFLAVHPEHPDRVPLLGAAIFANRTLGFVNAPALMQRVVARMGEASVDLERYASRRRLFLGTCSPRRRSTTTWPSSRPSSRSGSWRSRARASPPPGTSASPTRSRGRPSRRPCRASRGSTPSSRGSPPGAVRGPQPPVLC
jgi:aspartate aminotransferase